MAGRVLIFLCLVSFSKLYSQGCSDAGFCSLDGIKPISSPTTDYKRQLKIGMNIGQADHDIRVIGNYLELNTLLNTDWSVDVKLTSLSQKGDLASSFGLSDVYLNANRRINTSILTFGVKIPLINGDIEGASLPMDFQPSLGTLDAIIGYGVRLSKLGINLAAQIPLTQNKNTFIKEFRSDSRYQVFSNSNDFKRKADVLVRLSYPILNLEKLKITSSLLPIYHMGNDTYTRSGSNEIEIEGSKGLTLNGNVFIDFAASAKSNLQLSVASPFVVRDTRPDGLTRAYVVNFEYAFRF